jgi:hypothetical protein
MAHALNTSARAVYARRLDLIKRGYDLPIRESLVTMRPAEMRIDLTIDDGIVIVGSDAHYWPGEAATAHKGFVWAAQNLKPFAVILNGDILDGATGGNRHPRNGWEKRPSMKEEIDAVQQRTGDIEKVAKGAKLLRTHGNHDMRWDSYFANNVGEAENAVEGMALDHFLPHWRSAWTIMVNGHTLITHRVNNGVHATWTATASTQINTVTGHLHSLRVTPRTTMSPVNGGVIYGVDCGTLADVWGPQFGYMLGGPRNWRAGFAVLTFMGGYLMPPEIAMVIEEDEIYFRGQKIDVSGLCKEKKK